MPEDCKTKIALIEQQLETFSKKLQELDDVTKEFNSLIRKVLLGVSVSFIGILTYLAKGVLDKVG